VALSGDRLAVSARRHDTTPAGDEGALYVFRRNGEAWDQEPVVGAVMPIGAVLGTSLALDGSLLVAGAERHFIGGIEGGPVGKGAIVAHRWTGTAWLPVTLLVPSDPGVLDLTGWDVTLSGPMVVGGSPNHVPAAQPNSQGIAYAFDSLPPGWSFRGGSVAGADGHPILSATGALDGGDTVTLRLEQTAPVSPALLVLGFSALQVPFKGGVLVPHPDVFVSGLGTNAQGVLSLSATWPNLPTGATLYFQYWIADAEAVAGLAASNGVRAQVP
jgi:hypothetical protein